MLKLLSHDVWAWDAEWVPNPVVGRLVYGLPAEMPDRAVIQEMWAKGGGTAENPRPYLKTALCQVVSIAAVVRKVARDGTVKLDLVSLPTADESERDIIDRFLTGIGKTKPQLVGFNSVSADLPMLLQRSVAYGLSQPSFCARPNKPWEGIDYFAKYSDHHIDLKELLSGWGKGTPSLHEIAVSCGIPGKLATEGDDVVNLWLAGDTRSIVQYNECDALTTYELLMRVALLSGMVSPQGHVEEMKVFDALLIDRGAKPDSGHILAYILERQRLRAALNPEPAAVA